METNAIISDCGKFRYSLSRVWDASKPKVLFIMLNPSTADAETDDNTIRRCRGYAESWGYGGFFVGNLFPFRSTEPKELLKCDNPIGSQNDQYLRNMADHCSLIVCAWGNSSIVSKIQKKFPDYMPLRHFYHLHYLELSKDGTPKHPLYLLKSLTPIQYTLGIFGPHYKVQNIKVENITCPVCNYTNMELVNKEDCCYDECPLKTEKCQ